MCCVISKTLRNSTAHGLGPGTAFIACDGLSEACVWVEAVRRACIGEKMMLYALAVWYDPNDPIHWNQHEALGSLGRDYFRSAFE